MVVDDLKREKESIQESDNFFGKEWKQVKFEWNYTFCSKETEDWMEQ